MEERTRVPEKEDGEGGSKHERLGAAKGGERATSGVVLKRNPDSVT